MSSGSRRPPDPRPLERSTAVTAEGYGSVSDVRLFDPPPDVRFRTWPVIDEGWKGGLMVLGQLALGILGGWISESWAVGVAVQGLFLLAGRRFWLPTEYEVGSAGILMGGRRRLRWSEVRAFSVDPQGVMVWTVEHPAPVDAFSGLYLPAGELTDAVHAVLEFYGGPPATGKTAGVTRSRIA